jgi:protein-S-isoprenylcysteine O-methyltransferase Ste14
VQQAWVAVAFLVRRSPSSVSRRPLDWATALGGSFGGFLLRPGGLQPAPTAGVVLQVAGLAVWAASFFALGRSFGLVAADRGVVTRGPYRVVRHPLYASYIVTQCGYVLQSASVWNAAVLALTWTCQIARAIGEERLLAAFPTYGDYRRRVRWRLLPRVW